MTPTFSPIAIVGRSTVLPGALSPEALWKLVSEGQDVVQSVPSDRWRTDPADLLCGSDQDASNRAWSDKGGYVRGFHKIWDPEGFGIQASELEGLDPLFHWALHCARAALADAGDNRRGTVDRSRVAAVFGNLGFPATEMTRYAESVWQKESDRPPAQNRFMSGGAASLLEKALGLSPGVMCLDTACASSLYALKVACDKLQNGSVDMALAGAVNRADDLFIHVGFTALNAMSKTGQSRPFHADADGLVPGEGAGFLALKRLEDARRDNDTIYGVIRGIGLSNDGRGRGFLAPAEEGQERALRQAYATAGMDPKQISLLECHATGTTVGDAAEIQSTAAVFAGCSDVPIGSLKSNMGHLITAAGVAGIIKVLEAMSHGKRPPTLHTDSPNAVLANSPFRVLKTMEDWPSDGPRVAGVSAFGFGGNNAHVVISENDPSIVIPEKRAVESVPVAMVGIGTIVGTATNRAAFTRTLLAGESLLGPDGASTDTLQLDLKGLRFPPKDLQETLPQQLALLQAAREAVSDSGALPRESTGVFIGMEPDVEVCRYGLRWRQAQRFRNRGENPTDHSDWLNQVEQSIVPTLTSAGVVGTMPNIPANRLNSQFDLGGASLSISAGESSGDCSLRLALAALSQGDLDAAIVGAVDMSCQSVHVEALKSIEGKRTLPGDAAIVMVLKRLSDAERDGDHVYAVVEESGPESEDTASSLNNRFGRSWAAGSLRDLVANALTLAHHAHVDGRPWLLAGGKTPTATVNGFTLRTIQPPKAALSVPQLHNFGAANTADLIANLESGTENGSGPCQLVLVAKNDQEFNARCAQARRHIVDGLPAGPGVHFRKSPIQGDVAFVFTGAGSAYKDMGRSLMHALPELGQNLIQRSTEAVAAIEAPWGEENAIPPLQRLWGASALSQMHANLSQDLLGLTPDAVIGYSSGESNSLFATGTWTDLDAMITEGADGGLFSEEIGGKMNVVNRAWGLEVDWQTWTILAPVSEVQAVVDATANVHLSVIHSDNDCIVVGDAAGCAKVCDAFGRQRCLRLHYDLAVHVPELEAVREPWLELHRRETNTPLKTRVYSAGAGAAYTPTKENCAQAILSQANQTLDFRKVIEAAYADGVRVFIEHGPQGSCSRWIRDILGDREAVIVPLDRKGAGLEALLNAVAALKAAGIAVNWAALEARIGLPVDKPSAQKEFAAHPTPIQLPSLPLATSRLESAMSTNAPFQKMQPAPQLQPITSGSSATVRAFVPEPPTVSAPVVVAPAAPTPMTQAVAATPADPVMAALQAQLAALGATEQAHIAQQAALHQRFLAVQNQAMELLAQSPGMAPAAPVSNAPMNVAPAVQMPAPPVSRPVVETPAPRPPVVETPAVVPAPPTPKKPILAKKPTPKVVSAKPNATPERLSPTGPTFDRADLEIHAGGRISEIFGEDFQVQDDFHRQVRMPEGLLLLADRVTGLDAVAGSMGKGVIWSESDVLADSWYLHQGHIPAGVMIESGQADLMLISWLGVDFTNQNDRVYRLLGCELTYHGGLPQVGDTLAHEIHMDGHATQGDVRLMFFHSDCRVGDDIRLSVRKGQAGFFTEAELADSDGCLWTPEEQELAANPRIDAPAVACTKSEFSADDLQAFADGRPWDCFGPGYDRAKTHTRSPRIANGGMLLLGPITDFDTQGGPWGRGYLKSTVNVKPDTWFFDGHFKNDPCMPGTLMFEGCLQAMAVYMAALGYTVRRDGWRFEPVSDMPFQLSCRGQVTPRSKVLTYEIFVEEVHDGPIPVLYADILCTVDGLKAFHARRVALQMTPAWPLDEGSALVDNYLAPPASEGKIDAKTGDFTFDFRSLIACANGKPSEAFGPMYKPFDGPGRVARLPNPPYHFLSRVTRTQGECGSMDLGMEVDVEFDIAPDAWYFDENGCRTMPFAVLLEAALQPCGWLASYLGCALATEMELCFRNLDGKGTLHVDLMPDSGTLLTRVKSTGISRTASMIIVNFSVECTVGDTLVYELETVFGFFPQSALENQIGLPTSDVQRALLEVPANNLVDLTRRPAGLWETDRPNLAEPMLLMLDRICYLDPKGGSAGLGEARGEKDVDMGEWFFKAHFFQDPVQPGSLGIEAMIQLLQWTMLEMKLDAGFAQPRFETLGLGEEMKWKYRGQVIPENKLISSTLEITEIRKEEHGILAVATASLWADGKRIYEAEGLGMRIVDGTTDTGRTLESPTLTLDPEKDTWLNDHCPTWTQPALPMMSMVDLLAQGACSVDPVTELRDVRVKGWLTFDGPRELRTHRQGDHVQLVAVDETGAETEVAKAKVITGCYSNRPEALPALSGEPLPLPYDNGQLFHGPAFQVLDSLVRNETGASSVLHTSMDVPTGRLNPVLLDGATHGIPHDQLNLWFEEIASDKVAYPALIPEMRFYGPTPKQGTVRCEVRPDGFLGSKDYPAFQVQLIGENGVWCSFRLIESCFDKGSVGQADPLDRLAFLRDRKFVDGVQTSTQTDSRTKLTEADVASIDWFPGTVESLYGSRDIAQIAQKEHIARALKVHPGLVPAGLPLQRFDLKTQRKGEAVTVTGDGSGHLNLDTIESFWSDWFAREPWLVEDLYYGLIEQFVGKVVLTDPEAFASVRGRSLLYLGNHQIGVESLLFSVIASGLGQVPTVTLAKAEHRHTWLGKLIAHCFAYPDVADPKVIAFFDRQDKASLPKILGELAQEMTGPGRSVMVHVEGTRSLDCTTPVQKMSGAFLDMALAVNAPVVPIRFVGALPRETMEQRIEFPIGMGKQDIYIGRPILPEEMASMHYGERKKLVLNAINSLGPQQADEQPCVGNPAFAAKVADWQKTHGVSEEHAVLGVVLSERKHPVSETAALLKSKNAKSFEANATGEWLKELRARILGN